MRRSAAADVDDPWGERWLAEYRAQRPRDAVRDHLEAMHTSSALTQTWRRMYRPMAIPVTPEEVIAALNRVGVRPVLMGMHGIGGWMVDPRATKDVDVLVRKRDVGKAVAAIRQAYPELKVEDTPVVTRFIDPATGRGTVDVMKPTQDVFKIVFRHTIRISNTHEIPSLEMALASKFAAMLSPRREPLRKSQDAVDFASIIKANRSSIKMPKLQRLAEKVYPGGADEIRELIDDIDAGKMIQL